MSRSQFVIVIGVIALLTAATIVIGALQLSTKQPQKNDSTTGSFATFTPTINIFESLRPSTDEDVTVLPKSTQQQEDQLHIQNIIQQWETRPGSSDARAARANSAPTPQKIAQQIEREEITNLFNDLIGTKVTDTLAQQNDSNNPSNETLWLGDYTVAPTIVQESSESETQKQLRTYANELGTLLTTFNLLQGDQSRVLENFIQDRTNTTQLKKLTDGYIRISSEIEALSAPAPVSLTHTGLISSYASVGELLWELTLATNDSELIERMLTYNKSSEEVAKHHVALVTLLKAHAITFKSHEAGRIFTFTPTAGPGL